MMRSTGLLDISVTNTQRSKVHASALPANKITEFLPSETLAAAARVYTRTRLGGLHRPFFNVTITNVPGPPSSALRWPVHGFTALLAWHLFSMAWGLILVDCQLCTGGFR